MYVYVYLLEGTYVVSNTNSMILIDIPVWRFPTIDVPQIIQVMDDHDLVLKPTALGYSTPQFRKPRCEDR